MDLPSAVMTSAPLFPEIESEEDEANYENTPLHLPPFLKFAVSYNNNFDNLRYKCILYLAMICSFLIPPTFLLLPEPSLNSQNPWRADFKRCYGIIVCVRCLTLPFSFFFSSFLVPGSSLVPCDQGRTEFGNQASVSLPPLFSCGPFFPVFPSRRYERRRAL